MSPTRQTRWPAQTGFPRVSGDEPTIKLNVFELFRFSPRERG